MAEAVYAAQSRVLLNKKPPRGHSGVGYRLLEELQLCHSPPEHGNTQS